MTTCLWCRRNFKTTTKSLKESGLCASCWRAWSRPTLDETLELVQPKVFRTIRAMYLAGQPTVKVLAGVRQKHGREAAPGREWDEPLIVAADQYWRDR